MWDREYQEYPKDSREKQQQVEPGRGIVGCEMHETFGWAMRQHKPRAQGPGLVASIFQLFGSSKRRKPS